MKKFLIIRFSSIGDIVLTTPVMRCLKQQYPNAEIHFLTKKSFENVVVSNPYISKVWTIEKEVKPILDALKQEGFDFVVDLHKNIRSKQVTSVLKKPFKSFDKLNIKKWLLTNFKVNKMPNIHIVDRYLATVQALGVENDGKGLDFFIQPKNEVQDLPSEYVALVVGAAHATKALTVTKARDIIEQLKNPVVLVGGPNDLKKAEAIAEGNSNVLIGCGKYNLEQSASVLKQAKAVITPDTGMMHIAAALEKKVVSIWGNTVPEFGMYPYIPQNPDLVKIVQVENLSCRPCSKIGHEKCPKKHFKCIEEIDVEKVVKLCGE